MKKNPFIPKDRGKLAIVDGRVSEEILTSLEEEGLRIIKTIKCMEVEESISYHPDIVIHPLNHDTIVVAPNVFDYYYGALSDLGIRVLKGNKKLAGRYPDDIAYNVARLNNIAIHNFHYTDDRILEYIERNKIGKIEIKQGYSKCSLMIVDEESAITSDKPMYSRLKEKGYDVLLIDQGHIDLPGQVYGFIGGASGSLSRDKILISGKLDGHPNKNEILEFIEARKKELIYLSWEKIIDIGTIIVLG